MAMHRATQRTGKPSLSLVILLLLLALLAIAGGASRADALGQVVVRAGTAALLGIWIVAGGRTRLPRALAILLGAVCLLPLVQLVPLPPSAWLALPGRETFAAAATLSGIPQPWRPIALVPDGTLNALFSLIVPVAALVFAGGCRPEERSTVLAGLLMLVGCSALIALAQTSGVSFRNPFINARPGVPSGLLANRNHQALLLAIGCLIAPVWAFLPSRAARWRIWAAGGCVIMLLLMILATGSRGGLLLGALAVVIALALVARDLRRMLRRAPGWVWPVTLAGGGVAVVALAAISIGADRADSLKRLVALDPGQDMRARGFSTVVRVMAEFFPVGSGLGSFDPMFRLREPFALLKPTYFNHAHNDFLELALEGGLVAIAILVAALAWWAVHSMRAWRSDQIVARLGSGMILLVLTASAFDYPARTPIIMTVLVLAAIFLVQRPQPDRDERHRALRVEGGHL